MTNPDLGGLQLESIIVHDVPKHRAGEEGPAPALSEVESPADQDLRNYFRERLIATLGSQATNVVVAPKTASPVPALIEPFVSDESSDFVDASQKMAMHLHEVQTGTNPAGLLIVVKGKFGELQTIGILKLEREEAVSLDQVDVKGKRTFGLQHLRDLMLNRNTRVFKAAAFWLEEGDLAGLVSDEQRPRTQRIEVASFFLRFLGCALKEEPSVTTKKFLHTAEDFINEDIKDPSLKTKYHLALLTEMNSRNTTIDPRRFSRDHLEPQDQDKLRSALSESAGITASFPKDLSRVQSKLKRVAMDFDKNILLVAPPDVMENDITIEGEANDETRVEFRERLRSVHGKS